MRCLECNSIVENDANECEVCGAFFNDEDIETMLLVENKEKKERVRKRLCLTLFITLSVIILMLGLSYYLSKVASEKYVEALSRYYVNLKMYMDATEGIESYSYNSESVNITLKYDVWDELTPNEKYDYGSIFQSQLSKMRNESGLSDYQYVILQITLEDGQMVLYTDKNGYVQLFDYEKPEVTEEISNNNN